MCRMPVILRLGEQISDKNENDRTFSKFNLATRGRRDSVIDLVVFGLTMRIDFVAIFVLSGCTQQFDVV